MSDGYERVGWGNEPREYTPTPPRRAPRGPARGVLLVTVFLGTLLVTWMCRTP